MPGVCLLRTRVSNAHRSSNSQTFTTLAGSGPRYPSGQTRSGPVTTTLFMNYRSVSEQDTKNIAKKIAASLKGGDIVLLYGELGAGKSTFTRGIAEFFKINETVTSPTFTLMNIYPIKNNEIKQLAHIDTYRLKNEQQMIEIGAEDYLGAPGTVCFIEWPEKLDALLQNKKIIKITIEHDGEERNIAIN